MKDSEVAVLLTEIEYLRSIVKDAARCYDELQKMYTAHSAVGIDVNPHSIFSDPRDIFESYLDHLQQDAKAALKG